MSKIRYLNEIYARMVGRHKCKLKDLIKPAAVDGHWNKSFKTGLCQGLKGLTVKEEQVAEPCRPVKDNNNENSVVLGGAVRIWDENGLPRIVLLLVPDLQELHWVI